MTKTASLHSLTSVMQVVVAKTSGEVVRHVNPVKFLRVVPHGQLSLGIIVNKVGSGGFRDCGPEPRRRRASLIVIVGWP